MSKLILMAAGREADVFALDGERVLRRYRHGRDATAEVDVMRYVTGHGFPAPRVHSAAGADLVLERLTGHTMRDAFAAGTLDIDGGAHIMAELHRRLHALPPRPGAAARDRVVHLDLHPENIMLTGAGPVLIDWANARDGAPDLDLAVSALILAEVAVNPVYKDLSGAAAALLAGFLRRVGGDPRRCLPAAVAMRRGNTTLTGPERDLVPVAAALVTGVPGGDRA